MKGLDGVLFDLDGTLCEYRRTTAEMLALVHETVGVDQFVTERDYLRKYGQFAEESGGMADLRERCFVAVAEEKGRDPDVAREMAALYADRRDHSAVDPLPGAVEVLESIASRRPVGLVTNGDPEMQRQKLATLGIADLFDCAVFAGYRGVPAKPDPEPFEVALDRLDLSRDGVAYVGNSQRADVAGARAAGLYSVLLATDPDPDPAPDHRIKSLPELRDLRVGEGQH